MASFLNLFLDLNAPTGVVLTAPANSGTLAVTGISGACTDSDKASYKMKFWGATVVTNAVAGDTEANAPELPFDELSKTITFASEGAKTLNFAVYDQVGNRTQATAKSINIVTTLPSVTVDQISGGVNPNLPANDAGRFSLVSTPNPYNTLSFRFSPNADILEWKVKVVSTTGDLENSGTDITATNGSTPGATESISSGAFKNVTIKMADLPQTHGDKIIKVFVRSIAGWSQA